MSLNSNIHPSEFMFPKLEINDFIQYKKKKKQDNSSNFNKMCNKKIENIYNYERSFDIPNNEPDLYLINNINSPIKFNTNLIKYKDTYNIFNTEPRKKTKDSYVDMSTSRKKNHNENKRQPLEYKNFNVKNLEYEGPLNPTFTNNELIMFNNLISQILSNSTKFKTIKTKYKRYRLNKINMDQFDLFEKYQEDYTQMKEELYIKEAANLLMKKFNGKKKEKEYQRQNLMEIKGSNNLDNILENLIRKIEIRKENNELISVENITIMIKEEIENENKKEENYNYGLNSEMNHKYLKKENNNNNENKYMYNYLYNYTSETLDNLNINTDEINRNMNIFTEDVEKENYIFFPPISTIHQITGTTKENTKENNDVDNEPKIPFLDYDIIANVKKKYKKGKGGHKNEDILTDNKKEYKYIKDENGNYIRIEITEENSSKKNQDQIFIDDQNFLIKNSKKKKKPNKRSSTIEDFGFHINYNYINNFKNYNNNNNNNKNYCNFLGEDNYNNNINNIINNNIINRNKNYRNFFGEDVLENRRSFYMNFQKTLINFPNKNKKIDSFLITQSSFGDEFGQTFGSMEKKIKIKLRDLNENKIEKNKNGNGINDIQEVIEDNKILNNLKNLNKLNIDGNDNDFLNTNYNEYENTNTNTNSNYLNLNNKNRIRNNDYLKNLNHDIRMNGINENEEEIKKNSKAKFRFSNLFFIFFILYFIM
jgi:hypothetical protein